MNRTLSAVYAERTNAILMLCEPLCKMQTARNMMSPRQGRCHLCPVNVRLCLPAEATRPRSAASPGPPGQAGAGGGVTQVLEKSVT